MVVADGQTFVFGEIEQEGGVFTVTEITFEVALLQEATFGFKTT
jgi:hypothetical protein